VNCKRAGGSGIGDDVALVVGLLVRDADGVAKGLAVPAGVPLLERVATAVMELLGDPERVGRLEGVRDGMALGVGGTDCEAARLGVRVDGTDEDGEGEAVFVRKRVRVGVRLLLTDDEGLAEALADALVDTLGDRDRALDRVAVTETVAGLDGVPLGVAALLGVPVGAIEELGVPVAATLLLGVPVGARERLAVPVGEAVGDAVIVGETVGKTVFVGETVGETVAAGETVDDTVAVGKLVRVAVAVLDCEAVTVAATEGVGEAEGHTHVLSEMASPVGGRARER
jgi:hypothetical protein